MKNSFRFGFSILCLFVILLVTACQSNENPNDNQNANLNEEQNVQNEQHDASNEEVERTDGPGGFLWKVEHGDTLVYLQGTIHIGEESFYPLDYRIEEAFEASDVVLPEIDMNNLDMGQMMQYVLNVATYGGGMTLEDHLPAELYAETAAVFEEIGLPIDLYKMYRPWFIQMLISEIYTQSAGYDFQLGIDQHLLNRAAEAGKEVRELESYEEQMELLAGFSDEVQFKLLEDTIAHRDKVAEQTSQLVSLWVDGDIDGMLEMLTAEQEEQMSPEYEQYMKAMNDDRNIKMTEKIIDILEEDSGQTYFVMVGTMHMIAEPSIVSILQENGYEVEHIY